MKLALVVALLAAAAGRVEAQTMTPEIQTLRERADEAQLRLTHEQLAQSMRRGAEASASEAEAAWARALRASVLAEVRGWSAQRLLDAESPAELLGHAANHRWTLAEGLDALAFDVDGALPQWLQDAIRQRIGELAVPARVVDPKPVEDGWLTMAPVGEPQFADWHGPAVWSGPAVRDRAASYRSEGGSTRIRLAVGSAPLLWRMAIARGAAVRIALDDDDGRRALRWNARLPLRVELRLPVWLVTPQGLLAATLNGARADRPCDGGGWTALQVPGPQQPPVWAILFLPDEASARAARVHRVATPAKREDSPADQVGALEIAWPDQRLPALRVVAKRFGSVWGSYAEVAQPTAQGGSVRLSAAGSPECALR